MKKHQPVQAGKTTFSLQADTKALEDQLGKAREWIKAFVKAEVNNQARAQQKWFGKHGGKSISH